MKKLEQVRLPAPTMHAARRACLRVALPTLHAPPPPARAALRRPRRPRRPRSLHASRRWQGEEMEEGALTPHKAKVKEAVDSMMKKILAERAAAAAEAEAAAAEAAAAAAEAAAAEAAAATEAAAAAAAAPAEEAAAEEKPDGAKALAEGERLSPAVEALVRSESWRAACTRRPG